MKKNRLDFFIVWSVAESSKFNCYLIECPTDSSHIRAKTSLLKLQSCLPASWISIHFDYSTNFGFFIEMNSYMELLTLFFNHLFIHWIWFIHRFMRASRKMIHLEQCPFILRNLNAFFSHRKNATNYNILNVHNILCIDSVGKKQFCKYFINMFNLELSKFVITWTQKRV